MVRLRRLPWPEPLTELLRKPLWIAGGLERLDGEERRSLMVLPAARAVGPHHQNHVGTRLADQTNVVAHDLVLAPLLERLLDAEGVSKVDGAGEELLCTVEPMGCEKFLRAEHTQCLEQLGTDLVLTAVAASGCREHHSESLSMALHRQERVVLVVGMSGRMHDGADRRK